ncbi:hypothetical protein NPIL_411311 [Nephila pilipes]|uniref:Uncharacterized protein n=1 Tax=Nephila pilipes TaxID=299642 RepID=A0A8X6IK91_NEPPI|nr:hypothetical protein NPIL_411311 [Nephila pilipes]
MLEWGYRDARWCPSKCHTCSIGFISREPFPGFLRSLDNQSLVQHRDHVYYHPLNLINCTLKQLDSRIKNLIFPYYRIHNSAAKVNPIGIRNNIDLELPTNPLSLKSTYYKD